MLFLLDNYDSFTYNLAQYFQELGQEVLVARNDQISVEEIAQLQPEFICLSSGAGRPENAGIALDCVAHFAGQVPILGVALGHQIIAQAFGASIHPAQQIMHGKNTQIIHQEQGVFAGLPSPFQATCYHALTVDKNSLPEQLAIIAEDSSGEIMGLRHQQLAVTGVQFHPESIFTEHGKQLLNNFLKSTPLAKETR